MTCTFFCSVLRYLEKLRSLILVASKSITIEEGRGQVSPNQSSKFAGHNDICSEVDFMDLLQSKEIKHMVS